jgi:hypothetical protein
MFQGLAEVAEIAFRDIGGNPKEPHQFFDNPFVGTFLFEQLKDDGPGRVEREHFAFVDIQNDSAIRRLRAADSLTDGRHRVLLVFALSCSATCQTAA